MLHIKKKSPWLLDPCISPTILRAEEAGQAGVSPLIMLIQPRLLYVCQRLTFIKVSAWHLSTYVIKYELSQKKCFIFFPGTKKMFVSRSVLKKKLCANFSEKKNITESNNLGPPPPQKSNGASLIRSWSWPYWIESRMLPMTFRHATARRWCPNHFTAMQDISMWSS